MRRDFSIPDFAGGEIRYNVSVLSLAPNPYNLSPMHIFIFGNPDLPFDSLPLRILPELQKEFPEIKFEVKDPNEEWDLENSGDLVILDTAVGIDKITIFEDLEKFAKAPRVSMHDFDALTNLRYLQKIGKIKKVRIIAIPPDLEEKGAVKNAASALRRLRAEAA